jgi:DNA replication protein DnaC
VIGKRSKAAREGLDHVRFLSRLAELELIDRERRMVESRIRAPPSVRRLRKLARLRFPAAKSFDRFGFAAIPSRNKPLVLEPRLANMASPEIILLLWIIALGNSGTGKTHACLAPGLAACPFRRAQERRPGQLLHGGRTRSSIEGSARASPETPGAARRRQTADH